MVVRRQLAGGKDLSPSLGESVGLRALADAIIRRLTTTQGELEGHPDYGFNLDELIGTNVSDSFIRQQVLSQVFAEEEVEDARCKVTRLGVSIVIEVIVFAPEGDFPLTITVDELGAEAIVPADI